MIAGRLSEEIEHLASHAGLAQGMAHVVASLPLDASRRQLFVPQQVLESHGCGIEEVFAGKQTPKLRAALDQLLGEARGHLKTALALLEAVPPEVRPVFLPLAQVRAVTKTKAKSNANATKRVVCRLPFAVCRLPFGSLFSFLYCSVVLSAALLCAALLCSALQCTANNFLRPQRPATP